MATDGEVTPDTPLGHASQILAEIATKDKATSREGQVLVDSATKIRPAMDEAPPQVKEPALIIIGGECQDSEQVFTLQEDGTITDMETRQKVDVTAAFGDSLPSNIA